MRPPGPFEIGLIVLIVLIVFGVGKLPQVGAALGKGINAFKRGTRGEDVDDEPVAKKKPKRKAAKKTVKKTEPVTEEESAATEGKSDKAKPAAKEKAADAEAVSPPDED
jgi:sec-independent protein translocase protein TatA